ncbi:hypothetical protein BOTBODRAFT_328259 [Botryobasidium botryosum FD-172 SS1]|uniref:Uncharacterized protein n=1 Tax=Botryobasidium botryosum (strain FD-172 SS1) TaxID=930990 RepID=A0A067MZN8_BOTB1|nr:hypothetical protein BOTBODRAFT_328259 [Botryobasidium botryosum FD-172 SS1]
MVHCPPVKCFKRSAAELLIVRGYKVGATGGKRLSSMVVAPQPGTITYLRTGVAAAICSTPISYLFSIAAGNSKGSMPLLSFSRISWNPTGARPRLTKSVFVYSYPLSSRLRIAMAAIGFLLTAWVSVLKVAGEIASHSILGAYIAGIASKVRPEK